MHVTTLSVLEHVHLSDTHPLRMSPLSVSGNMYKNSKDNPISE
jgi:hypothetical protein